MCVGGLITTLKNKFATIPERTIEMHCFTIKLDAFQRVAMSICLFVCLRHKVHFFWRPLNGPRPCLSHTFYFRIIHLLPGRVVSVNKKNIYIFNWEILFQGLYVHFFHVRPLIPNINKKKLLKELGKG